MISVALILWGIARGVDGRGSVILQYVVRWVIVFATGLAKMGVPTPARSRIARSVGLLSCLLLFDCVHVVSAPACRILRNHLLLLVEMIVIEVLVSLILLVLVVLVPVIVSDAALWGAPWVCARNRALVALSLRPDCMARIHLRVAVGIYASCFSRPLHSS